MKMRRGRNGLTKTEFLQLEMDAEVAKRVEKALSKAKKAKCYPVPRGNVSTCPKNESGWCSLSNKKCNNILQKIEGEPK